MEKHGIELDTDDVARTWINLLPVGATFTAERDSYLKLIEKSDMSYQFGGPRGVILGTPGVGPCRHTTKQNHCIYTVDSARRRRITAYLQCVVT